MLDPAYLNSLTDSEKATLLNSLLSSIPLDQKVAIYSDLSTDPQFGFVKDLDIHTKRKKAFNELLRICGDFNADSVTSFFFKLYLISAFVDKQLTIDDLKQHNIEFLDPCFLLCSTRDQINLLLSIARDGLGIYKALKKKDKKVEQKSNIGSKIDDTESESNITDDLFTRLHLDDLDFDDE